MNPIEEVEEIIEDNEKVDPDFYDDPGEPENDSVLEAASTYIRAEVHGGKMVKPVVVAALSRNYDYVLNPDHTVRPAKEGETAGLWADMDKRRVAETHIEFPGRPEDIYVSTVFLVLDRGWGSGPPVLFETMIFGMDDEYQWRYTSWDDAVIGHHRVVSAIYADADLHALEMP